MTQITLVLANFLNKYIYTIYTFSFQGQEKNNIYIYILDYIYLYINYALLKKKKREGQKTPFFINGLILPDISLFVLNFTICNYSITSNYTF